MTQVRPTCILLGGESGERIVSIHSGIAVAGAVLRSGRPVLLMDPASGRVCAIDAEDPAAASAGSATDEVLAALAAELEAASFDPRHIYPSLARLVSTPPSIVAILLHGGSGEDGRVQAVLDLAGIPYTGSGPAASALAMDKVLAKRLMRAEGIPVAEELLWGGRDAGSALGERSPASAPEPPPSREVDRLGGYPLVVKPIAGGSTLGLTIVQGPADWATAWAAAEGQIDPERGLLVEQYLPGREVTVGILEDQALPVVEIVPKTGFYDYRRKYTKGETRYEVPADLPPETAAQLAAFGLAAFRALGCRDMGRVDFRLAPDGRAACLEVNTVPGMTATSLLPMAAAAVGIGFDALVGTLCRRAADRGDRDAHGME